MTTSKTSTTNEAGWSITAIHNTTIYNSSPFCTMPKSHAAWKRELGLTRYSNQDLPEGKDDKKTRALLRTPKFIRLPSLSMTRLLT